MREGVDKSERYVKNIYRTTAEIGLVLTTIMIRAILSNLWDDEDEERVLDMRTDVLDDDEFGIE